MRGWRTMAQGLLPLTDLFTEYRMYYRKEDGLLNKINGDLMSATPILRMGIHTAREMEGSWDGLHAGERGAMFVIASWPLKR